MQVKCGTVNMLLLCLLPAVLGSVANARTYEPRLVEWPLNLLATDGTLGLPGKQPEQVAGYFKVRHHCRDLALWDAPTL